MPHDATVADAAAPSTAIREYLTAVYPAAQELLHRIGPRQLAKRFDNLDYFYSCAPTSLVSLQPPLTIPHCTALPYIPGGAFYRASGQAPLDQGRFNAILWSEFDRHRNPVQVLHSASASSDGFHSSFGARLGPQPSWTSPLAIVRYVHHPNGLERDEKLRKAAIGNVLAHEFDVANSSRVARLRQLRDGDAIEVEQWGGLTGADECPPICGLWANVWHGTGVMLRVRRPFVSLNKATALIEMFAALEARNASALMAVRDLVGVGPAVNARRERHPSASLADCLGAHLLSAVPHAGGHTHAGGSQFAMLAREWKEFASRATPQDVVRVFFRPPVDLSIDGATHGAARFALHWTFGISGKTGKTAFWKSSPTGPDGLLMTLACVLGHHTVLLAAASNDNGLLHQELVDFELPPPLGWTAPIGESSTNDPHWCMTRPFEFVQEDAKRGPSRQAMRRVQMREFWQRTGKFRLPTDPGGALDQPTRPCDLAFGNKMPLAPEGELSACRGPKTRVPRPTSAKACYAWCNGTLSASSGGVSLAHARRIQT